MLTGTIYISADPKVIHTFAMANLRIINMDEDNSLGIGSNITINGTCLLPPMEAKIAEADGNEQAYDMIYSNHLLEPFQQQFIAALIAFLYKGGNLLIYLPENGYNYTKEKFINFLFRNYGIKVGVLGHPDPQIANYFYDNKCIPIWLNLIYSSGVIGAKEYLLQYPEDAYISNVYCIDKLLSELLPYGNSLEQKKNYILRFHKLIHKNPNLEPAIGGII